VEKTPENYATLLGFGYRVDEIRGIPLPEKRLLPLLIMQPDPLAFVLPELLKNRFVSYRKGPNITDDLTGGVGLHDTEVELTFVGLEKLALPGGPDKVSHLFAFLHRAAANPNENAKPDDTQRQQDQQNPPDLPPGRAGALAHYLLKFAHFYFPFIPKAG
jgi:hypothetical protein